MSLDRPTNYESSPMVTTITKQRISTRAVLTSKTTVLSTGAPHSMRLWPATVSSSTGIISVSILGTLTQWDNNTTWGLSVHGLSVEDSALSVGNSTTCAWALLIKPGIGNVSITDGECSSTLLVTK